MLSVLLVYSRAQNTSTLPQRLTSPPCSPGGFLRFGGTKSICPSSQATRSCARFRFQTSSSRSSQDGELATKDFALGSAPLKRIDGQAMKQDEFRKWLVGQRQTGATASCRVSSAKRVAGYTLHMALGSAEGIRARFRVTGQETVLETASFEMSTGADLVDRIRGRRTNMMAPGTLISCAHLCPSKRGTSRRASEIMNPQRTPAVL